MGYHNEVTSCAAMRCDPWMDDAISKQVNDVLIIYV